MSSTVRSLDRVRAYFDREAGRFDAIYETDRKPLHQRVIDRARRVVVERYKLVCNLAPSAGPWTALDVGCGSGRYAIEFARLGATVVALDVSESMIALGKSQAAAAGVSDRIRFAAEGFLDFRVDETFDVVTAMGYFDYLEDPVPHLRKMLAASRGRVFASIPKRWEYRVPIRMARFALAGGYVRFYSHAEFLSIAAEAGVRSDRLSLIDLGRDWLAVIRTL
jgi:2-polyprenyl-3-methyl-5-hydroxy-6-metoxy-1,4-benzoquinol methylase